MFQTGRRRRVRVRVRPAVDDFVTAESQHFNSALNSLFQDQYKYNPVREPKRPAPATRTPEKSTFQDFLTEILKNSDDLLKTTTEVPEVAWTMAPAMTTPMVIEDVAETTEIEITTMPTTYNPEETTTLRPSLEGPFSKATDDSRDVSKTNSENEPEKKVNDDEQRGNAWESTKNWEQNGIKNTLNLGSIAEKLTIKQNEDTSGSQSDEVRSNLTGTGPETSDLGIEDGPGTASESVRKENPKDGHHPKNHRAKWSEVRYPSVFDHSQASPWNQDAKATSKSSTATIPGLVTESKGDASVRTLTDYVQAIFDTMKSAKEETTDGIAGDPDGIATTMPTPMLETEFSIREKSATKDAEATTRTTVDGAQNTTDVHVDAKTATQTVVSMTDIDPENATTLERNGTTSDNATSSSTDRSPTDSTVATSSKANTTTVSDNSTESILGKVLRTSTTTKVSHMTEICYRGRCVMTRPSRDDRFG